ncbi:hypothetical protein EUX98_g8714 [Antrodiella citrinella]|uniref:Uncharacterized protein n=1 Tax=Antrodiella citrinella TaxID=2447956 RepID=A0A4S4M3S9_9APHY|nr:hypothetical protein EUX98_g8714 [Antrodiella citrinella]
MSNSQSSSGYPSFLTGAEAIFSDAFPNPFEGTPSNPLYYPGTRVLVSPTQTYYTADPEASDTLFTHIIQLRDVINNASHGYIPGLSSGPAPLHVRVDSVLDLRMGFPAVYPFLQRVQDRNILAERLTLDDLHHYWNMYHRVARDTISWIRRSFTRARSLQGTTLFAYEVPYDAEDEYFYRFLQTLSGFECDFSDSTRPTCHEEVDDSDRMIIDSEGPSLDTNSMTDIILHPVLSSTAPNALIPYSPLDPYFHSNNSDTVTSQALITHPIYGRNARNALILYNRSEETLVGSNSESSEYFTAEEYTSDNDVTAIADNDSDDSSDNLTIIVTDESDEEGVDILIDGDVPNPHVVGLRVIDHLDLPTTETGEYL